MEIGLRDRVALISGASQGLGRAIALAFAAEGCHLALCARNAEALQALGAEIRQNHNVTVYVEPIDMASTVAIEGFVARAVAHFGRLDVCIANCGGPPARDFLATSDEDWSRAFDLSLRSTVTLARAVIPVMRQNRWGRFITISSITVRQPLPQLVLSNAIRTGVMGLVRTLASDFGRDGITANNVGPGYTATARLLALSDQLAQSSGRSRDHIQAEWTKDIPVGRLGQPEDVADTVVFLASERAGFITGQTLLVDGGMYKGL